LSTVLSGLTKDRIDFSKMLTCLRKLYIPYPLLCIDRFCYRPRDLDQQIVHLMQGSVWKVRIRSARSPACLSGSLGRTPASARSKDLTGGDVDEFEADERIDPTRFLRILGIDFRKRLVIFMSTFTARWGRANRRCPRW